MNKILDQFKLKGFAEVKINVAQKLKLVLGRVVPVNFVGKGEKCWLPAFSPFPIMFSKVFFLRVIKSRDCVVKC